jgi:hypothetical protein
MSPRSGPPSPPVDFSRERWLDLVRPAAPSSTWAIPPEKKAISDQMFNQYQMYNKRRLSSDVFIEVFSYRGLDNPVLKQAWNLADYDMKGFLDIEDFAVAMYLLYLNVDYDQQLPKTLPLKLIPPSKREPKRLWSIKKSKKPQRHHSIYVLEDWSSSDVFMRDCAPKPAYGGLSKELWAKVFERVTEQCLTTTAQVSKLFHTLSIPRIFKTINFDIPNYQRAMFEYAEYRQPLPEDVQFALVQQYRFKKTLLRNPEYGSHIRSFRWTLAIKGYSRLPEWIDDEKIAKETYEFYTREAYKMFGLLRNATYVHINATEHFESLLRLRQLFPYAEYLHLGGSSVC